MTHHDQRLEHAAIAVLTVSDTRTPEDDRSGSLLRGRLESAGYTAFDHAILPDEPGRVRAWVVERLGRSGCDGVIVNGGTGISSRDRTYEALSGLLERRLPGFGELFRTLSFEQVGARAMLSRAVGGVVRGKPLFALPGSPAAVELGMDRLVIPVLGHLLAELRKH